MKSVRPLVTITILTVVGVFLFRQLNKGPALDEDVASQWNVPAHVPGVTAAQSGPTAPLAVGNQMSEAPAWAAPAAVPSSTEVSGLATGSFAATQQSAAAEPTPSTAVDPLAVTESELPEVPSIPELPPVAVGAAPSPSDPATTPLVPNPSFAPSLPATTPVPSLPGAAPMPGPSLGSVSPDAAAPVLAAVATSTDTTPLGALPDESPSSAYALTKPVILGLLSRGDLPNAHLMLSQWHGNETLTDAERAEVETLLSQLAGTVIYSNEHRLEPAYTVQSGDNLESIAGKYQVPWQLLAKINGIPQADAVQPGQQLKVLRGPFMAVVDISAGEVALLLDGRYAGKFPLQTVATTNVTDGEWVVENKLLVPAASGPQQTDAASAVDRVLVLRSSTPTAIGTSLSLGSGPTQSGPSAAGAPPVLQVSPADAEELHDILSIGSRVVIRR
jgi:LysM repeat protein